MRHDAQKKPRVHAGCNGKVNMKKLALAAPLLFAAAFSCNTARMQVLPRIELTTEGGIAGRGTGSVTVEADRATAASIAGPCGSAELTAEERDALSHAAAKLHDLDPSYVTASNPHGNADQIRYTLVLGGRKTVWITRATSTCPLRCAI